MRPLGQTGANRRDYFTRGMRATYIALSLVRTQLSTRNKLAQIFHTDVEPI